ncbi:MAG: anaerobic C4-dicarboxylate transporter [Desulfobacteraceae bacterium]|nr:anaerobic C4-dicarboxylate transporter [Desulfobacteraceae bacterium]
MDLAGLKIYLEFAVVIGAILLGSRSGGVGLGLWGGVGVLVLAYVFGLPPTAPPVDVMLIILAVIMATSVMEAAGGIDFLVRSAEGIIRKNPRQITIVAPLVSYAFTFGAGTGHVFYPLLPIIHEVAHENGIRPERPIAVSTIASQQAITASPVSAAMAAMIALFEPLGFGLTQIILIALPATICGVFIASLVQTRIGKELKDDPEYNRRLKAGEIDPPRGGKSGQSERSLPKSARLSAVMFLLGVAIIVVTGLFPSLRPAVPVAKGGLAPLDMATTIQIVMLSIAALIMMLTRIPAASVPKTNSAQAGLTAIVGIFGLAWLGDTFIKGNEKLIIGLIGDVATAYPVVFAAGLFFASVLLFSQAATTRALMPLGISLGLSGNLVAMWPAVNGYFFLPTYGTLIAAINFDRTGTTRIGRFVLNHSFMLPGLVSTTCAIAVGLLLVKLFF